MNKRGMVAALIVGILIGYFAHQDKNDELSYGSTGLPKNCRAIIKANIDAYYNDEYSAEEIISSINRNCGEFGYSWSE